MSLKILVSKVSLYGLWHLKRRIEEKSVSTSSWLQHFFCFCRTLWGCDFYFMRGSCRKKSWTEEMEKNHKKCLQSQLSLVVPTLNWKEPNISLLGGRAWSLCGQEWILCDGWEPLVLPSHTLDTYSPALLGSLDFELTKFKPGLMWKIIMILVGCSPWGH